MKQQQPAIIVIGGSWGGIQASLSLLKAVPANFKIPVLMVLHRQRNVDSDLKRVFSKKLALKVCETEEKEALSPGHLYLAPANYHVLIERDGTFSLDSSELENYSRPSIDVTFSSAATVYGSKTLGILLSGASKDGSNGMKDIADRGGVCLVQHPDEAEVATMPESAIRLIPDCSVLTLKQMQELLISLA